MELNQQEQQVDTLLAGAPVPTTEDAALDSMEEFIVSAPRGYDDGDANEILADVHMNLKRGLGTTNPYQNEQEFIEQSKSLDRATLNLGLALDAKHVLEMEAHSPEYVDDERARELLGWDMSAKAATAVAKPQQAAIEANVALQVPYTTPMAVRDTLVLADTQLVSMGRRIGERKLIDFSTSNYALDLAAHLPGPRQGIGLMKFDFKLPDTEMMGYFDTLKAWQNLDPRQRMEIWESLEPALWEAAGNNALVYSSMALPFVYEEDEFWVKFNTGIDTLDTAFIATKLTKMLFNGKRLSEAMLTTRRLMKANDRALQKGNQKAAAAATVRRIRAKDIDAVKEGSPVNFAATDPSLSPNQGSGIAITLEDMHIYQRAVEKGFIEQGEDLFVNMSALRPSEITEPLDEVRKLIVSDGAVILDETASDGKIVFTVSNPAKFDVPLETLKADRIRYAQEIKDMQQELRRLVSFDDEFGSNFASKESILTRIDALRTEIKDISLAIKKAAPPKGSPAKLKSVKMPGTETRRVLYNYSVDDASGVGKFSLVNEDGTSFYAATIGTPEAALGHMADNLVSRTTLLRQQQRRVFGLFEKPLRKIKQRVGVLSRIYHMDRTSRGNLEALLNYGDDVQKRFDDGDLLQGIRVDGLGFHKFTPREVEAYNEMRDLYDDLWRIGNKLEVDELTFAGYSQFYVRIPDAKDSTKVKVQQIFAKARNDDFLTSVPRTRDTPIKGAVDLRTGIPFKLDAMPSLQKGLDSGTLSFVRLKDDVRFGKETYGYGLVETRTTGKYKEAVGAKAPGPVVLDYRDGYVPKLAGERISHLVIVPSNVKKDGLDLAGEFRILRGFKSGREAEIYAQTYLAKHPGKAAPQVETLTAMRTSTDKRITELANTVDQRLFRGAFVGHREEASRFLVGLEGRQVERVDPFTSLQRYADFVATNYPMHEWKQAQIKRFIDMARKTDASGSPSGGSWLDVPTRWDSKLDATAPHYRELKVLQENMRVTFAVPTQEEMVFNRLQRNIVDGFDRLAWNTTKGAARFGPGTTKALVKAREAAATSKVLAEPVQATKSLTFNLMMSFLNLRQWFIQSSGMFISAGTHPLEAIQAFNKFLFVRSAQAIATDVKEYSKLAKAVGISPKEAEVMLRAWYKSGIPDSILENADFGYFHGTHGAYYSKPMLHEIMKKNRFFYDSGELNNRGFAFALAFQRKVKEHKWNPTKTLNDEQLQEVVQEALRLNTNMGPANAAKWQNVPIVNLKTQFWQQTHKFYENMGYAVGHAVNKNVKKENMWTGREVANTAIMHLLLGGAASLGIDEMWAGLDQWMFDPQGGGLDPSNPKHAPMIAAARGGLLEYMTMRGLGFTMDLSDNVLPASGSAMITQAIGDWLNVAVAGWKGEKVDFKLEMLIGASANIGTRFGSALSKTIQGLSGALSSPEGLEMQDLIGTIQEISKITSAGSNADRMATWKALGTITDKEGKPLYVTELGEELPLAVYYAKLAGFDPLAIEVKYLVSNRKKDSDAEIAAASMIIKNALRRQLSSDGRLAPERERRMAENIIATTMAGLPQSLGNKAMANAYEELNKEYLDGFPLELYKRYYEFDTGSEQAKEALLDIQINEHYKIGDKDAQ